MADIKVEMRSEDINQAIADAIVKSVLGDTIVKMVNEYVKKISSSYDNPVQKIIEQVARDLIGEIIYARRKELEIEIQRQLTSETTSMVINRMIERITKSSY